MIPGDPIMLMSFLNTKLRDEYDSPDALCNALELDRAEIEAKLAAAGFVYNTDTNQYR